MLEEVKGGGEEEGSVLDELEMKAINRIREHYKSKDIFKTSKCRE